MKVLIPLLFYVAIFPSMIVEARFSIHSWGRSRSGHRENPWESGAYSRYSGPNSWESRKEDIDYGLEEADEAMKNRYRGTNYGPRGCVGLCLYNKLHGNTDATTASDSQKEELQSQEVTSKPCVGRCQYYRSLGIPDPYSN
jgi:hypothetical protein